MDHSIRFARSVYNLFSINYRTHGYSSSINPDRSIRHSYMDWFLIPSERWSIEPPECKTNYVDIGGSNGSVDLTEALSSYPVYKNREGQMRFKVRNDRIITPYASVPYEFLWNEIYRDMCLFLHGKRIYMLLEDDPEWYYYGRFSVGKYDASDKNNSEIVISYNVEPYKKLTWINDNDCYWDSMPLQKGSINNGFEKYENTFSIEVNDGSNFVTIPNIECGNEPVVPKFVVNPLTEGATPDLTINFWNEVIGLQARITTARNTDGETAEGGFIFTDRQIVLTNLTTPETITPTNNDFVMQLKGHAKVSLIYDIGVL